MFRYEQELRDQQLDRERLTLAEQNRRLLEEVSLDYYTRGSLLKEFSLFTAKIKISHS